MRTKCTHATDPLRAKVAQNVLDQLGTPPRFIRTTISRVAPNAWRVNVWCERPGGRNLCPDTYIPHSYYVTTSNAGQVISSEPPLERLYDLPIPSPAAAKPKARRRRAAMAAV